MSVDASTTPSAAFAPSRSPVRRRARATTAFLASLTGGAAVAAAVLTTLAIVLAAAERRSFLSGPARHGFPGWMVGPLAHHVPGLTTDTATLRWAFVGALCVMFVCWLVASATAPRLPLALVVGALLVVQAILLLSPPLSLTDLFNYLHYGRMSAHGFNPYVDLPIADHGDVAYRFSNWHHLPSPYGPLFTLLSSALGSLPLPVAYWIFKALASLVWLGCLAIVWWLARRFGRSPQRALVFAGLNPAVVVWGLGGVHNDGFMILCALGAVALIVRGRDADTPWWDAGAGLAVATGMALKPSLLPLAPLVVLGARRRLPALGGLAAGAGLAAGIVAVAFGGHLPATRLQAKLVTPLSVPNVLGVLTGHGGSDAAVRSIAEVVLVLAIAAGALVVWRRRERLPVAAGAVMLAAALTLSWTMPWYVWWSLPFAALARSRVLVGGVIALTLWLGIGAVPQMPKLIHAVGYYPTRSATGHANHVYTERLLK